MPKPPPLAHFSVRKQLYSHLPPDVWTRCLISNHPTEKTVCDLVLSVTTQSCDNRWRLDWRPTGKLRAQLLLDDKGLVRYLHFGLRSNKPKENNADWFSGNRPSSCCSQSGEDNITIHKEQKRTDVHRPVTVLPPAVTLQFCEGRHDEDVGEEEWKSAWLNEMINENVMMSRSSMLMRRWRGWSISSAFTRVKDLCPSNAAIRRYRLSSSVSCLLLFSLFFLFFVTCLSFHWWLLSIVFLLYLQCEMSSHSMSPSSLRSYTRSF